MSQSQEFTYVGPSDEVDVVVRVRRGEKITVPAGAAGRPPRQEFDEHGVLTSNDPGEGLLAQPHAWEPTVATLESMTIAQLQDHASAAGIDLGGATRKADIIAAIEAADTPQED